MILEVKRHSLEKKINEVLHQDDEKKAIEMIDTGEIDFDLTGLLESKVSDEVDSFQSINPLKAFSRSVEVDLVRLNNDGFITPKYSNTLLSSTYRRIKRPLLNNIAGKGASQVKNTNMIMLTSALPGEGKTFSSINLAISIAMEQNKNVLLVDADVNKASHYKIFGIENMPGLTDFLLGDVDNLSDVLCRTNIPSLTLLSSGTACNYSTELFASESMDKFIDEISIRYQDRVIIFDGPPLLNTTEATVLAEHMGQIIMVVEAESTLNHMVKKGLDFIRNEIVLLLLNKQREKASEEQYGYGYGNSS